MLPRLAEAYAQTGDVEMASRTIDIARQTTPQARGAGSGSPSTQLAVARILLVTEGPAAGRRIQESLDQAEAIANEYDLRDLPEVLIERARLADAVGDLEARRRFAAEARRIFLENGAPLRAAALEQEFPD